VRTSLVSVMRIRSVVVTNFHFCRVCTSKELGTANRYLLSVVTCGSFLIQASDVEITNTFNSEF